MRRALTVLLAIVALVGGTVACTPTRKPSANDRDRKVTEKIQSGYQQTQPIPTPSHGRSQKRQTLIEIEKIMMDSTPTYTYAFHQGVPHPIFECDSIGLPIPTTDQLSNPLVIAKADLRGDIHWETGVINQMEPTGVYTGDSTGTHNLCLNGKGQPFDFYWEGFVASSTQELRWDETTQTLVQVDKDATVDLSNNDGSGKDSVTTDGHN